MKIITIGFSLFLITFSVFVGVLVTLNSSPAILTNADAYQFLKDNEITIWGIENCGWCRKQKEEFGVIKNNLIEEGIYIDCHESQAVLDKCIGFNSGTPFWVKDNEVIYSGYIPVSEIEETLGGKI